MKKSFVALILALATLFSFTSPAFADDSLIWSNKYPEAHKTKQVDLSADTRTDAEIIASIEAQGVKVPPVPSGDFTRYSLQELDIALQLISPKMRNAIDKWLASKGKGPVTFKWTMTTEQYPVGKPTLADPHIDLFYSRHGEYVLMPTHSVSGSLCASYGYLFYEMLCDTYGTENLNNTLIKLHKDALGEDTTLDVLKLYISDAFAFVLCYSHRDKLTNYAFRHPHTMIAEGRPYQGYLGYEFVKYTSKEMLKLFPESKEYVQWCIDTSMPHILNEAVFDKLITPYDDYSAYPNRNKKKYTRENIDKE